MIPRDTAAPATCIPGHVYAEFVSGTRALKLCNAGGTTYTTFGSGSGDVTGVTTANGVSATKAGGLLTFTLGNITPSSVSTTGYVNVADGQTYRYNSTAVIFAQTALSNYFFGPSGNGSITGTENVGIGATVLGSLSTGVRNVAVGQAIMPAATSASNNMGVGYSALYATTTGSSNVAVGTGTLAADTTGSRNVAIGEDALRQNTTGSRNVAIGMQALYDLNIVDSSNSYNTAIGYNSGRGLTTGTQNTLIGANITGLSSSLSNTVIIADGGGNQRIVVDSTGKATINGKAVATVFNPGYVTFATLPASPSDGDIVVCSDCTVASPTASGGSGALIVRIGGVWVGK